MRKFLLLTFAFSLVFSSPSLFAQENQKGLPGDQDSLTYRKGSRSTGGATLPAGQYPAFDKVTADMTVKEGFFNLYYKEQKLYGLVKTAQLRKPFFMATSISRGIYTGMQWDDMLVYWYKFDNQLLLLRPNLRYRAGRTTLREMIQKTYPSTVIRALPILSQSSQGYLVDFGKLFKSDLAGLSRVARGLLGVVGRLNPTLSRWSKIKAFPYNVELGVDIAFTGLKVRGAFSNWTDSADGSRSHFLGVHYSLSYFPQTTYRPRRTDDRVGYFHTAIKDFSRGYSSKTKFRRYIHRWNLEKADPTLKMSPPQKPIVFYLEKTVPYKFRQYVRAGILEWNKAFEKVGFVNAMEVRQQTDTEFADLDPEDVRYNFFRWVTNDFGFAAGPSRVNPITGEILDADIIFDDSMIRYVAGSYGRMGPVSALWEQDEKFMSLVKQMAGWNLDKQKIFFGPPQEFNREQEFNKIIKMMQQNGRQICLFTHGMKHQLAMASLVMKMRGLKKVPLEFLGEYIKEIVMHEVGHTLGLYHNFKASSWLPLSKVNSKDKPTATVGSVMDYNPINFTPKNTPQGHFVTQTLGPYDYWAILYGYCLPGRAGEEKTLQAIASQSALPGYIYGNDLYASLADPDPQWLRWDMGNDPIEYAKLRIALGEELLKDLQNRAVHQGENYYGLRRAFGSILGDYSYGVFMAARNIGGVSIHFHHKGDRGARAPLEVVSAKKQRDALEFLKGTVFSEKAFEFDPVLLQHLAPGTQWHWESDELSPSPLYPFQQIYLRIQSMTLAMMLNPRTLWRIQNSSLQVKKGTEVFTIEELLNELTSAIWSELDRKGSGRDKKKWSGSNPFISAQRRNLQRFYLSVWLSYFVLDRGNSFIPEDAKNLGRRNLRGLLAKLTQINQANLDGTSRAHLQASIERIQKALSASYVR